MKTMTFDECYANAFKYFCDAIASDYFNEHTYLFDKLNEEEQETLFEEISAYASSIWEHDLSYSEIRTWVAESLEDEHIVQVLLDD